MGRKVNQQLVCRRTGAQHPPQPDRDTALWCSLGRGSVCFSNGALLGRLGAHLSHTPSTLSALSFPTGTVT